VKWSFVVWIVVAGALGTGVWRTEALRVRMPDARPEAVVMGGTLLALASILRRNAAGLVK
jgi:hypothetical protein